MIRRQRLLRLPVLLATLAVIHLTPARECSGQATSDVEVGDRIRLAVVGQPAITGTLVDHDSTHLVLDVPKTGRHSYELASIQKLERSGGYYRDGNVWPAVGIGAAAGALAGLGFGYLGNIQADAGGGVSVGISVAVGAGIGAVAGAIVGSGPKKERWEPVPLGDLRVGFQPPWKGTWSFAVSLSL